MPGPSVLTAAEREASDLALGRLAGCWPGYWIGCDVPRTMADVRSRFESAAQAWKLRKIEPMGGGGVALVCAATQAGRPVIVKVNPRVLGGEGLRAEGRALRFWQSTGAVAHVLDLRDDEYTLLLARIRPGDRLEDARLPVEQMLTELGRLAAALHATPPPPESFPPLARSNTARHWRWALAGDPLQGELDRRLSDGGTEALLHGDLHGRNALRDVDTWKIIDPHALLGDRHAEIQPLLEASLALPASSRDDAELVDGWVRTYAHAAGMQAQRAAAWTRVIARARALGSASRAHQSPEDAAWASGLNRLAEGLGTLA